MLQGFPGMQSLMTSMMKKKIRDKGVASIEELRQLSLEAGVRMIGCQMTIDLFDFSRDDFIEGIDYGGAATFLEFAGESDVNLFI